MTSLSSTAALPTQPVAPSAVAPAAPQSGWTDIGDPNKAPEVSLSFSDFLSAINPLQHIPIIGTIYRAITGDTINPAAKVLGGALLGGPLGLIASAADAVLEQSTGKDLGEQVLALVAPDMTTPTAPAPQYAAAPPSPAVDSTAASPAPAATASTAAAPQPTNQIASAAADNQSAAPLSHALLGAAPSPSPAVAVAAGDAPTGLPLQGLARAGSNAGAKGWTLADYRAYAGHAMPTNSGSSQLRNEPVPLQTTVPIVGEFTRTQPIAAAAAAPVAQSGSSAVTPAATVATAAMPTDQSADSWVAQAMMAGLDRYREMMQRQQQSSQPSQSKPQVDGAF